MTRAFRRMLLPYSKREMTDVGCRMIDEKGCRCRMIMEKERHGQFGSVV